jgi:hypothetical protein
MIEPPSRVFPACVNTLSGSLPSDTTSEKDKQSQLQHSTRAKEDFANAFAVWSFLR